MLPVLLLTMSGIAFNTYREFKVYLLYLLYVYSIRNRKILYLKENDKLGQSLVLTLILEFIFLPSHNSKASFEVEFK